MKKIGNCIYFIIFFSSYINCTSAQPLFVIQISNGGQAILSTYIGGDEFNQPSIDYSIWKDCYPWGRSLSSNIEHQWYSPGSNITFQNNKMKITTNYDPAYRNLNDYDLPGTILVDGIANHRLFDYTSGMLYSKQRFDYGLYFINCKMPTGKGIWPAFWIFRDVDHEIDVFEYKGETTNKIHWDVHCLGCGGSGGWVTANGSFASSFNTLFSDWQNNYVTWGLNAQEYAGELQSLTIPSNVIVNTAVANDNGPFSPGPDQTTPSSVDFEVDYIRIYKRINCDVDNWQCSYNQSSIYTSSTFTGKNVYFGSPPGIPTCDAIVENEQFLTLVGSESVNFLNGFDAQIGSIVKANVVDCGPFLIPPTIDNLMSESDLEIENLNENSKYLQNNQEENISHRLEQDSTSFFIGVYPNPSGGIVKLDFSGPMVKELTVEIIDSQNKLVFLKKLMNESTIDLSALPKGKYQLICKINNQIFYKTIILI